MEEKKVIVAMSGGKDSSVAAALEKRAGFEVVGVFMKFWSEPSKDGLLGRKNRCCSPQAEKRARKVAQILDIPFYVVHFEKEFKTRVVDYFLKEYREGRTPNPCVVCNKEIKFGMLLEKTLGMEADFISTGHYARKKTIKVKGSEKYELFKAKDKNKDQSYFLWQLDQNQLSRVRFPLGEYKKDKVKEMAQEFGFPVSEIPESQEVCFIQTTLREFLKKHLEPQPGKIVNSWGKVLGKHNGLYSYTIGQRKGIGLSGGPYYVLDKDPSDNTLIVTRDEKDLYRKELVCKKLNWISEDSPQSPLNIEAKIRYGHRAAPGQIERENQRWRVIFKEPQRAIAPGQSVVFYKGEKLLGGGYITSGKPRN